MEQMSFRQYINRKYDNVKGLIEMNCIILKIEFKMRFCIVGAGVIGLSIARSLKARFP